MPANHAAEEATLFLAGHIAPAGTYRLVGTSREIRLDQADVLPATGDGRVAVYECRPPHWNGQPCSPKYECTSTRKEDQHP